MNCGEGKYCLSAERTSWETNARENVYLREKGAKSIARQKIPPAGYWQVEIVSEQLCGFELVSTTSIRLKHLVTSKYLAVVHNKRRSPDSSDTAFNLHVLDIDDKEYEVFFFFFFFFFLFL